MINLWEYLLVSVMVCRTIRPAVSKRYFFPVLWIPNWINMVCIDFCRLNPDPDPCGKKMTHQKNEEIYCFEVQDVIVIFFVIKLGSRSALKLPFLGQCNGKKSLSFVHTYVFRG